MSLSAILWDFDGTLADSTQKTIEVSLDVLSHFRPDIYENVPKELSSKRAFREASRRMPDWRELYRTCYGCSEEELIAGAAMWGEAQLKNQTEPELYEGIPEVLRKFAGTKMGICTQNSAKPVLQNLEHHGVLKYFGAVIGIDDVAFDEQKPHPAAFINCLEKLGVKDKNANFAYIGDLGVDVAFGRNAEAMLRKKFPKAKVWCIAMHHPGNYCEADENFPPDFVAHNSAELFEILNGI